MYTGGVDKHTCCLRRPAAYLDDDAVSIDRQHAVLGLLQGVARGPCRVVPGGHGVHVSCCRPGCSVTLHALHAVLQQQLMRFDHLVKRLQKSDCCT